MVEKFILGVPHLDAQHRSLFTGIERIRKILDDDHDYERKRRACEEGICFLRQHSLRHFSDEEAYMLSINDGRYPQHKEQHDALLADLAAFQKNLEETDYSISAVKELLGTLMSWLAFHTNEVDSTIGKKIAAIDPINDAAVALEKTVTQIIPDLFGITPSLIDGDYQGEYYENEIFCLADFSHSSGAAFRLLTALDQRVVLQVVNSMFSTDSTQLDEMGLSAIRELVAMLAIRFAQHYHGGVIFRIDRTIILSIEELTAKAPEPAEPATESSDPAEPLPKIPDAPPLCSLLFHQSSGAVSMRLWQLESLSCP